MATRKYYGMGYGKVYGGQKTSNIILSGLDGVNVLAQALVAIVERGEVELSGKLQKGKRGKAKDKNAVTVTCPLRKKKKNPLAVEAFDPYTLPNAS